jgi:hypothetical protein
MSETILFEGSPEEVDRLEADLAQTEVIKRDLEDVIRKVEDVESLLARDTHLPHKTDLGIRLQERLGEMEDKIELVTDELATITSERDKMESRLKWLAANHYRICKGIFDQRFYLLDTKGVNTIGDFDNLYQAIDAGIALDNKK